MSWSPLSSDRGAQLLLPKIPGCPHMMCRVLAVLNGGHAGYVPQVANHALAIAQYRATTDREENMAKHFENCQVGKISRANMELVKVLIPETINSLSHKSVAVSLVLVSIDIAARYRGQHPSFAPMFQFASLLFLQFSDQMMRMGTAKKRQRRKQRRHLRVNGENAKVTVRRVRSPKYKARVARGPDLSQNFKTRASRSDDWRVRSPNPKSPKKKEKKKKTSGGKTQSV